TPISPTPPCSRSKSGEKCGLAKGAGCAHGSSRPSHRCRRFGGRGADAYVARPSIAAIGRAETVDERRPTRGTCRGRRNEREDCVAARLFVGSIRPEPTYHRVRTAPASFGGASAAALAGGVLEGDPPARSRLTQSIHLSGQ